MKTYQTMIEALNDLKNRGYTLDFNLAHNVLHNSETAISLNPDDFEISEFYRFEGITDPADAAVVYAIHSPTYHVKGVFVDAYGVYADDIGEALLKKLSAHPTT